MQADHINKVQLDFSFSRKEKDRALEISRQLFYENILPQLEAGFAGIKTPVYIDRLEIDMGNVTEKDFETVFSKTLKDNLKIKLDKAFRPGGLQRTTAGRLNEDASLNPDRFLFFLENGYWPWNLQNKTGQELQTLIREFFDDRSKLHSLIWAIKDKKPAVAERLIMTAAQNASLKTKLLNTLKQQHKGLAIVSALLPLHWETKGFTAGSFYRMLLLKLIQSQPVDDESGFVALLQKLIAELYPTARPGENDAAGTTPPGKKTKPPAADKAKRKTSQAEIRKALLKILTLIETKETGNQERGRKRQTAEPALSAAGTENEMPVDENAKIHINNAGLVIFHPFLPVVFRELGWVGADKKFTDRKAQQKAILFLQYLVNGKSRQAEHELVLNKILCNWPLEWPLAASCNFSSKEKEAAADIIDSLREQWRVMKNTSARGLVESFVKREGLLQKQESGYLLQVERKTIDILMETLPVGISLIKLPWNEQIIYTEW